MQKKINIIVWSLIPCLILFFGILSIKKHSSIHMYEQEWTQEGHQIMIKVYDQSSLDWNTKLSKLRRQVEEAEQLDRQLDLVISDLIKQLNTESYVIQIDEQVAVGKRYQDKPIQVATMTSDHQLFKIMALEEQSLFVTDVTNNQEYQRIFVLAATPKQANDVITKLQALSLKDGKTVVNQLSNIEVYWLENDKVVGHIKMT